MFFSLLGYEKQQSSLHAPWAQVCNENRSTAITQKSVPEHTQGALHTGLQLLLFFPCVWIRLLLSVPNEAMQRVWWGVVEGEEASVRRMLGESTVCPQRESQSEFQIYCKGMATFDGLLLFLSPFFIFLMPRHTIKVKEIWLILSLVKIPYCAPVYSVPFS